LQFFKQREKHRAHVQDQHLAANHERLHGEMAKHAAIGTILAACLPVATLTLGSWTDDQAVQQRLAAGQDR